MEGILLVDVMDAHGALWSVPASRIRLVKHGGSGAERYDKIVTDGDEELICVWHGREPTTLVNSLIAIGPCMIYKCEERRRKI